MTSLQGRCRVIRTANMQGDVKMPLAQPQFNQFDDRYVVRVRVCQSKGGSARACERQGLRESGNDADSRYLCQQLRHHCLRLPCITAPKEVRMVKDVVEIV
jgi:hypothetical protein